MLRGSIFLATCVAVLALAAPPARAQALNDTLGYIRDSIAGQGQLIEDERVTDSAKGQSWTERWTILYGNLRTDMAACSLTFHADFAVDGKSTFSGDLTYVFGQVSGVRLTTMDQNMDENDAKGGNPTWSVQSTPPSQDIQIKFADGHGGGFYIRDAYLARRLAASIARAADLCGATASREGF
jgi:hypothetical protein